MIPRSDPAVTRALDWHHRLLQATGARHAVLSHRLVRWLEGATPRQTQAYYAGVATLRRTLHPVADDIEY